MSTKAAPSGEKKDRIRVIFNLCQNQACAYCVNIYAILFTTGGCKFPEKKG